MESDDQNGIQFYDTCGQKTTKPPHTGQKNMIKTGALTLMTFLTVAGTEEAVGSVGPFIMLVSMLIAPFLWSLPMALMSAELSTMIPTTGGSIRWVMIFGPFWGYHHGYLQLVSNFVDNAATVGTLPTSVRTLICLLLVVLCVVLNVLGLEMVGLSSLIFAVLIFSPFFVLMVIGAPYIDPNVWMLGPPKGFDTSGYGTAIAVILWQMSGWDAVVSCVEEIHEPRRTIPRAFAYAMLLMIANYVLPVMVGVCISHDPEVWTTGSFTKIGEIAGGKWLGTWITIAGVFACVGQLNVNIATTSREAYCMCDIGKLHPTRRTPWMCILFMGVCIFLLTFMDFTPLVEMDSILISATLIMEFAAFIKFKYSHPDVDRPYKVPGRKWGAWLLATPPTILSVLLMVLAERNSVLLALLCTLLGIVFFYIGMRWDNSGRFLFCGLCRDLGNRKLESENEKLFINDSIEYVNAKTPIVIVEAAGVGIAPSAIICCTGAPVSVVIDDPKEVFILPRSNDNKTNNAAEEADVQAITKPKPADAVVTFVDNSIRGEPP